MKSTRPATLFCAALCGAAVPALAAPHTITLEPLSSARTTPRNNGATPPLLSPAGAALIVAHDPESQRLFVVNQAAKRIDVLGISDPAAPVVEPSLDVSGYGAMPTSAAIHDGVLAVAVTGAAAITDPGAVIFFEIPRGRHGENDDPVRHLVTIPVGPLPDMITFTPNGRWLLAANEGEALPDYTVDPEGSISIIDLDRHYQVSTARFTSFNSKAAALRAAGVRIYGPNATVAQDLEPEWITVSQDCATAWVTLQENNAIAIVDIRSAKVKDIKALGTKDFSLAGNAFDPSDVDGGININPWPVKGIYQPDAVETYRVGRKDYLVMANEGSARDAAGPGNEAARLGTLTLDPVIFPNAADLKQNAKLGRLSVSKATGDTDGDGDIDVIQCFGGRSFSIRTPDGKLVWDSGSEFERRIAEIYPASFNASNSNNTRDDRSDDRGPEPEGVAIGKVFGKHYAFIALERMSGVMVYDISNPVAPRFVEYANNRDFTVAPALEAAGDLGSEGLAFIKADDSPNGSPLLVVANEVSGTTTIFEVVKQP